MTSTCKTTGTQRLCTAVAALAAGLVLSLLPARAQDVVTDFSAGPGNGRYAFPSWTPRTLLELMRGPSGAEAVNIVGHLFWPVAAGDGAKVPAVLLMHGSGGIHSAMLDYWPKLLNAAGYAVFALDIFGPRGVQSTFEDQSQLPWAADLADAFAALKLLATHPRIDAQRIAIMGFSRGGSAAWRTAVERVIASQALPGGLRFAAHVPVYSGGCVGVTRLRVRPGVFSTSPMLWVHGDADDYSAIGPCQDYAQRIGAAGTPVTFIVIEGARHGFDRDDPRRLQLRGAQRLLDTCPLEMDIDTLAFFDRGSGQRLQGEAFQAALKGCSALGASVEGDRNARDKAGQAVLAFLARVMAR